MAGVDSDRPNHIAPLPNEILSIVFLELQRASRARGTSDVPVAETTVSHVCSHWRAVSLSTPQLWSVFEHVSASSHVPARWTDERLAVYLERSKGHPFDLWIDFATEEDLGGNRLLSLLHMVLPHLHRCRVFHILSDRNHPLRDFREILANAAVPLLEICALCPDHQVARRPDLALTSANIFQTGAPSLKYVRLDETSFLNLRPPLESVVHLRIEERRVASPILIPNSIFDEIISLPNLETFSLFGYLFRFQNQDGPIPNESLLAKNLKEFRTMDPIVAGYIFSHVLTPSLQSVMFPKFNLDGGDVSIPAQMALPSLRTVTLMDPGSGSHDLEGSPNTEKFVSGTYNVDELSVWGGFAEGEGRNEDWGKVLEAVAAPSTWTNLKRATLSMPFTNPSEIEYYHKFIRGKPQLEVLCVPPGCLERPAFMDGVPSHLRLQPIDYSKPGISLYRTPGPDWMDTEEDPFLRERRMFEYF
ncbi:hypothetical protein DFP72DRAFT_887581 [Ephemerocybe angulata]|uniref:F-box domain-containing protein n=1 Tax=Ephemerocybe angulata TaxID=980116 RepID=A0A8H6I639_9AGAR|nr:hypothetical protein DFP72DRAFT_887581 [Tulosesus angulatus]